MRRLVVTPLILVGSTSVCLSVGAPDSLARVVARARRIRVALLTRVGLLTRVELLTHVGYTTRARQGVLAGVPAA